MQIICDNARYYRAKAVQDYIKDSRIKLVFCLSFALYAQFKSH